MTDAYKGLMGLMPGYGIDKKPEMQPGAPVTAPADWKQILGVDWATGPDKSAICIIGTEDEETPRLLRLIGLLGGEFKTELLGTGVFKHSFTAPIECPKLITASIAVEHSPEEQIMWLKLLGNVFGRQRWIGRAIRKARRQMNARG